MPSYFRLSQINPPLSSVAALLLLVPAAAAAQPAKSAEIDCKRTAGRMQVRLLELRGGGPSRGAGAAAGALQSVTVPIFGGSKRGMDAAADRDADIAKMRADNAAMKAQGCPYYDIDAELSRPHDAPTPKLIKPAKR